MNESVAITLDDKKHLTAIAKALSVETRIEILKLLCKSEMNVNEISETLGIPASSAAAHVRVLEEAGIIKTNYQPGIRGSMKLCSIVMDELNIWFRSKFIPSDEVEIIDMPIGNYVDYKVEPTCGLVNEKGPIDEEDNPRCFYNPARNSAKLLWIGKGYVEYRFPNNSLLERDAEQIEISAELCSEDHEYNMDYPSDITLWINGKEVGTWNCPGDFGDRRGKLNPDWWPDKNTQYGNLKTWSVNKMGSFLDGERVEDCTIDQLNLAANDYIAIRIGVKDNAVNKGGFNLFGDCFGDYGQNIIMTIRFKK